MPNTREPVRLGVLGCADIAVRRILPAVSRAEGIRLTAVASRDAEKAAEVTSRFGGEPVRGYRELLERSDVDAVYLPLPTGLHAEWIRTALEHGKHVLAEKPMTTSPAQTRELVALAAERGLVLRENFMFTQHSQHDFVRKLLADGVIGQLRFVSSTFTIPRRPAGDIRHRADLGGGALLDNGAYPVHVARMFLGDDLTVAGAALHCPQGTEVDYGGSALLHRADGACGLLSFGMDHAYQAGYRLLGTEGSIELDRAFAPPEHHHPVVRVHRQDHYQEYTLPPDDQVTRSILKFAGAVHAGVPSTVDDHAGTIAQAVLIDEIRRCALR